MSVKLSNRPEAQNRCGAAVFEWSGAWLSANGEAVWRRRRVEDGRGAGGKVNRKRRLARIAVCNKCRDQGRSRVLIKAYVVSLLILGLLDGLWLGVVARDWSAKQLGPLMRASIDPVPAGLFYLIYPAAVAFLCVEPSLQSGWSRAALAGAVLGLAAYGAYDLTNVATLKNWPLPLTIVDLIWGTVVSAVTAGGAAFVVRTWWS